MGTDFEDAKNMPVEQAGMGGYCKVFCEILLEHLPNAEIWAFPNPDRDSFEHIFLKRGEQYIDARGVRSFPEIAADIVPRVPARRITPREMRSCTMISDGEKEETAILEPRIREHIKQRVERYGIENS
jgi:hypothetical protein